MAEEPRESEGKTVACWLPGDLFVRLRDASSRRDRSASWILRAALTEWLDRQGGREVEE